MNLKVIPNAAENRLVQKEGKSILYIKAPPEKDKANKAVIKFFKDELNLRVRIKSGLHSREKVLEILSSSI